MAKTKGVVARFLERVGGGLFSLLSGFEERGIVPAASRRLKLSLLGLLTAAIGALSAETANVKTCYIAVRMPEVKISDISVSPNPTQGADSVKVRATAKVLDPTIENNYIRNAWLSRQHDTLKIPMNAVDGKLNDTLEVLEAVFYTADLDTGKHWFFIDVTSSSDSEEMLWQSYIVTRADSLTADSTTAEEE